MQHSCYDFPDGLDSCRIEIQCAEGGRDVFVISSVTNGVNFGHTSLT